MGSEKKSKRIDAGVGGLVWVRRRNGSWWPGRIMGLHELSESCLVSPRSGTPVKLLGREDASVDWYNLEKSKRVKAFRCGEYDECIEKAKAAAANSNRKAVKYARREDAILHALELENALEPSEHHDFQLETVSADYLKQNIRVTDEEHVCRNGTESVLEANQTMELSQSGISFEDPNHNNISKVHSLQKNRRKTPNDSEDDGEGTKRMRGLEDLGMVVASERNGHSDGSHELVQLDSTSLSEPNICNSLSTGTGINNSRNSYSFLKRKRSQVVNIHDNLRRKNRRRPLTKVLESTAMVSVPVFCDGGPGLSSLQGVTDGKVSAIGSTESKMTKSSTAITNNSDSSGASYEKETSLDASEQTCDPEIDGAHVYSESKDSELSSKSEFPENDLSDGLFDVPFVGEENHSEGFPPIFKSCTSRKFQSGAIGRHSGHHSQVGSVSLSSEGLNESGSASIAVDVINVCQRNEKGTSKWQLKRKRNSRSLNKKTRKSKSIDLRSSVARDAELDAFLAGTQQMNWFSAGLSQKVEINTCEELLSPNDCAYWSKQISESNHSINYGRSLGNGEVATQSAGSRDRLLSLSHRKDLMTKSVTHVRKEAYMMEGVPVHQRLLPYRQSRFISHSRYRDADYHSRNYLGSLSLFDVNLEVRASYRGQHVPLVSLMSKLNGKAIVGHPITVEVWDDGYCDQLMRSIDCCPTSNNGELYEVPTENMSDQSHMKAIWNQTSLSPRKFLKNKKCGLLSKRTRKLSSFTSGMEDRKPVAENFGGLVIACVPLKVVFSRINEGVNHAIRSVNRSSTGNP